MIKIYGLFPFSSTRAPELMKTNSVIRIGNDPSTNVLSLSVHSPSSFPCGRQMLVVVAWAGLPANYDLLIHFTFKVQP